ncbi:MAG: DUF86 domain-containing protein [Bacteroidia bacterium]
MKKDNRIYLEHISDCIAKIKSYTKDCSEEQFLQSTIIQDAVIRNFEVIGEATKHLDSTFREKHPEIAWKKVAGLRDKLIHDYIGVDLWAVWGVVENFLPELELYVLKIMETEQGSL